MNTLAYAALWFFFFTLPWERVITVPGVFIVTKVSGGLALALVSLAVVSSGRVRRWHAFHVAAVLFVVWAGLLTLIIDYRTFPPKYWAFVQVLLVLWMVWELATTRDRVLGLFTAYVLGAYIAALDTIFLYQSQGALLRRFAAGGADPNDLAMRLALGLPMAWYLGMTYRRPFVQWVCRGYLLIALIALGLTGSRGGMIAAMVGLLIVPLTLTKLTLGKRLIGMVLVCVGLATAISYTPATLLERLSSVGTEMSEAQLGGRFKIWKAGLKVFALNPFFGYGTARFKQTVMPYGVDQIAHNAFLSVLVEQGLIGLLIYLAMFAAVFLSLMKLRPFDRRFAIVLFATMIVAMLPLTWDDEKAIWSLLAVLMGLANARTPSLPQPASWPPARPATLAGAGWRAWERNPAAARGPSGRADGRG